MSQEFDLSKETGILTTLVECKESPMDSVFNIVYPHINSESPRLLFDVIYSVLDDPLNKIENRLYAGDVEACRTLVQDFYVEGDIKYIRVFIEFVSNILREDSFSTDLFRSKYKEFQSLATDISNDHDISSPFIDESTPDSDDKEVPSINDNVSDELVMLSASTPSTTSDHSEGGRKSKRLKTSTSFCIEANKFESFNTDIWDAVENQWNHLCESHNPISGSLFQTKVLENTTQVVTYNYFNAKAGLAAGDIQLANQSIKKLRKLLKESNKRIESNILPQKGIYI